MDDKDKQAPLDTQLFRRVMGRFATGVTIITTEGDGGVRGMTANAFMSGSLTPMLCISKTRLMWIRRCWKANTMIVVNVVWSMVPLATKPPPGLP